MSKARELGLVHMVALYALWYNFIRIHKTLRVTPAMAAGVTDRLFAYEELVGIVDEWEANQKAENATNASMQSWWIGLLHAAAARPLP
jgi:hypothetical protein